MPGANCAFPQCGTCRRYKLDIFKIPNREGDFHEEWRTKILNILIKYHVKDNKLKEKIKAGTVYICERQFQESDIEFTSKWNSIIHNLLEPVGENLVVKLD